MLLSRFCSHKFGIQVVKDQLGFKETVIVVDDKLDTGMILPLVLGLLLECCQVALHLRHTSVLVDSANVRCSVEMQRLDEYFVHTVTVVVHKPLQILNRLVGQRIHQLNALEITLGDLLCFCLLIDSIFLGLSLDEIKVFDITFKINLVPSRRHLGPISLCKPLIADSLTLFHSLRALRT